VTIRIMMASMALALLAAPSWAAEIRLDYWVMEGDSCSVVRGKPKEKAVAGPFASRQDALEAIKTTPACQRQK